jgi:acetyl-CoA acetyltransferase
MGHPIGPTGIGQIGEIAMQLRGEAGLVSTLTRRSGSPTWLVSAQSATFTSWSGTADRWVKSWPW